MFNIRILSENGTWNFSPHTGRRYLVAKGNLIDYEIFFDENQKIPMFGWVPLNPFIERIYEFELQFKEIMTEQEAELRNLIPLATFEKNVVAKNEKKDVVEVQKLCIVLRKETVRYLLDREVHPFELKVISKDGGELTFFFVFSLKLESAKTIVSHFPGGNFLMSVEKLIIAELNCAFRSMTFDDLRKLDTDKLHEMTTKGNMLDVLNEKFKEHKFTLLPLALEAIVISPNSQDRIDNQEDVQNAKLKGESTKITAKAEAEAIKTKADAEAVAITKKGDAQTGILVKRTKEVGEKEADVLELKVSKVIDKVQPYQVAIMGTKDETTISVARNMKDLKGTIVGSDALQKHKSVIDVLVGNLISSTKKEEVSDGN